MNLIKSIEELKSYLMEQRNIIVYGAGNVSKNMLSYIKKQKIIYNICCIAVQCMENNPENIENLPVLPIHNLTHFSEYASVIIFTREDIYSDIENIVNGYGFTNVYALTEECINKIISLNQASEIPFFTNDIMEKLEDIYQSINNQNEIYALHQKTFLEYKNCNIGKDIVIVGTGPSLKQYKPMENAIHIGVNRAYKREDINWDYYFAQDFSPERNTGRGIDIVKNVKCKLFLGRYPIADQYIEAPVSYDLIGNNIARYFLDKFMNCRMYLDISCHPLMDYGTVAFSALQFALYTYPRKIYLVGCDTSYSGHFYDIPKEKERWRAVSHWRVGYAKIKTFADYLYPETEIISINPVGLKGLFRDVYM